MSIWREIRNTFVNQDTMQVYIDAYKTSNDNEEGKVIAKVNSDFSVEYIDERAKTDKDAQEVVRFTISDLLSEKAYGMYELDWMGAHQGACFDGCEKVCFPEFVNCEFQDEECMKYLLNDADFLVWESI